jgi:hypothetical protein
MKTNIRGQPVFRANKRFGNGPPLSVRPNRFLSFSFLSSSATWRVGALLFIRAYRKDQVLYLPDIYSCNRIAQPFFVYICDHGDSNDKVTYASSIGAAERLRCDSGRIDRSYLGRLIIVLVVRRSSIRYSPVANHFLKTRH